MVQLSPARNSTNAPAQPTTSAVPRSGCLAINRNGTPVIDTPPSKCHNRGGSGLLAKYQLIIIGTASFMISEG